MTEFFGTNLGRPFRCWLSLGLLLLAAGAGGCQASLGLDEYTPLGAATGGQGAGEAGASSGEGGSSGASGEVSQPAGGAGMGGLSNLSSGGQQAAGGMTMGCGNCTESPDAGDGGLTSGAAETDAGDTDRWQARVVEYHTNLPLFGVTIDWGEGQTVVTAADGTARFDNGAWGKRYVLALPAGRISSGTLAHRWTVVQLASDLPSEKQLVSVRWPHLNHDWLEQQLSRCEGFADAGQALINPFGGLTLLVEGVGAGVARSEIQVNLLSAATSAHRICFLGSSAAGSDVEVQRLEQTSSLGSFLLFGLKPGNGPTEVVVNNASLSSTRSLDLTGLGNGSTGALNFSE